MVHDIPHTAFNVIISIVPFRQSRDIAIKILVVVFFLPGKLDVCLADIKTFFANITTNPCDGGHFFRKMSFYILHLDKQYAFF